LLAEPPLGLALSAAGLEPPPPPPQADSSTAIRPTVQALRQIVATVRRTVAACVSIVIIGFLSIFRWATTLGNDVSLLSEELENQR
jgi:predicted anti-sigma-YlaC factor YlaD